jgi:hypothetical protein
MSLFEKVVGFFLAGVFILFVLRYPDRIVDFVNLIVDAMSNAADALGQSGGN